MTEHSIVASVFTVIKIIVVALVPFVEPQIAGMLGAIAYIIIRHEAKIEPITIRKFIVVMFFGWLGAWATINVLAHHYPLCPSVWGQILSATVGFLMYDILLLLGANTKSVVGFFGNIVKNIIEEGAKKLWK